MKLAAVATLLIVGIIAAYSGLAMFSPALALVVGGTHAMATAAILIRDPKQQRTAEGD